MRRSAPLVRTFTLGGQTLVVTIPNIRAKGGFAFTTEWTGRHRGDISAELEQEADRVVRRLLFEVVEMRRKEAAKRRVVSPPTPATSATHATD
jgi:hypothetical protein